MWRFITLGSILLSWLAFLVFSRLCAQDMVPFLPGRERWFSLMVNGGFLILSLLVTCFPPASFRGFPKSMAAIVGVFLALLAVSGLWSPLFASVCGPPWESHLYGAPISAGTPFIDSVWAWDVGDLKQN